MSENWIEDFKKLKPVTIKLSDEDYNKFVEALGNPPKPNEALKKLMQEDTDNEELKNAIQSWKEEEKLWNEREIKYREAIKSAIQCLTSGNSVMVSDPRPALKYLKDGLK